MSKVGYFSLNQLGNNLILCLNSLIFIYVISVGALIIPSMLPFTTFIGILLLLGGGILNLSSALGNVRETDQLAFVHQMNYSNILNPVICLLLLFLLIFCLFFTKGYSFISGFSLLVLHVLFLVFIINTKNYLRIYLRSYIFFVLLMAVCGIAANFLVSFGVVSSSNYANLSILTDGAFQRDANALDSYVFPYNLGLILTGGGKLDLLGFSFWRISGWAHEPTSATLFVAPAMILLAHTKIIARSLSRIVFLFVITLFWFYAMSLGSLFAFIILYSFYIIVVMFTKFFPLKLTSLVCIGGSIIFLAGVFYIDAILNSSLISTKLDLGSETFQTAIQRFTWFVPDTAYSQANSFSFIAIFLIVFLFLLNVFYSLLVEKELNPFALVVLYIVIHSMKGSQDSVFMLIFSFFWFYVLYFSISSSHSKSVKYF